MKRSELEVRSVGMAKEAVIRRPNREGKGGFTVDGQDFPWYYMEDGVTVQPPTRTSIGTITVVIPVEHVICDDPIPGAGEPS